MSAAQITQADIDRLRKTDLEALEVEHPAPGQRLTTVRLRRTYDRGLSGTLVRWS